MISRNICLYCAQTLLRTLVVVAVAACTAGTAEINEPGKIDPAATHVRLVVIPAVMDGGKPAVVALGKPVVTEDRGALEGIERGILARELVRQSLLIAARDELGLATRDVVAGDVPVESKQADAKEGASVELLMLFRTGKTNRALIRRTEGAKVDVLLDQELGADKSLFEDIAKLVTVAEGLSRTEFPGVLKKLGLDGKTKTPTTDRALPSGVEDRLSQLGFSEILSAVRDLHAANRAEGESPARVGALVRGYALLGVLSEFHWHPAHKAFKARALLYAERLVAQEPKSAWSLWHRAYAEALAGLNQHAIADLEQARTLPRQQPIARPPGWVDVIDAFAHCDLKRLKIDGGPQSGLAALLRLAIVEFPGTPSLFVQAAKDVLGIDAECYRAIDAMCQAGGVSNLHVATLLGPQMLEQAFPQRLGALDKLPAKVREQLDQPAGGEVALLDALAKAGQPDADAGEPSWGVLSHLIRETRFIQVYRRLHFMSVIWGVPAEIPQYWAESHRLVADHPYRPYLESFVVGPNELEKIYAGLIQKLDLEDLEINQARLTAAISRSSKLPKAQNAWHFAWVHRDEIARDCAQALNHSFDKFKAQEARSLLEVNPHSPFARATLVEHDWDKVKDQVGEWEKEAGDSSPALLAALARRYSQLKKFDEAERALRAYIKISPDHWGYHLLADNYKARNDLKHWQATLDEFLDRGEDLGLDHAQVGVELAEHFMAQKQWDKAWPYAEDAAETWAQWAMDCARRCAEGMEKYDDATTWAQRQSERYPESDWPTWYLCCKRTGHGDVNGARDFTRPYVEATGHPFFVGTFQWMNGERKEALASFKRHYEATPSEWTCLLVMMAADDLGDAKTREEFFKTFISKHRRQGSKWAQIWEMFHQALDQGKEAPIDLKAVDKILESVPVAQRGNTEFIVGRYLANHGKPEDARRYLTITLKSAVADWTKAQAGDAMSRLGGNAEVQKADDPAKKK
jgi:tetratricopeptide (TPR) repeat protein